MSLEARDFTVLGVLAATVSVLMGIWLFLNQYTILPFDRELANRNWQVCIASLLLVVGAPLIGVIVRYMLSPHTVQIKCQQGVNTVQSV